MFPYHKITLPSEGKAYPPETELYKSRGQLLVNSLLSRHEDQILETGHNPITLVEIAKELIVNEEVKEQIYNLSLFDFTSLLLAIRVFAYGPDIELNSICNKCQQPTAIKYNLLADFVNKPYTSNMFSCQLSNKVNLIFRQPTVQDFIDRYNESFTKFAKTLIIYVDDTKCVDSSFIDNLLSIDCGKIRNAYKKSIYGYDLHGVVTCANCDETAKLDLSNFTKTLFIFDVEYKKAIHSEIFQLAYATKGGFTFSDIYNMPCNMRKSYLELLVKQKEEELKAIESSNKNGSK